MSRALLAALVLVHAASACSGAADDRCSVVGTEVPDHVARLGCPADYDALGFEDAPFGTFAHTNTVNVVLDRETGRVYYVDTETWWLHFDFVYFVLQGNPDVEPTDPSYRQAHAEFNVQTYQTQTRRYAVGKLVQFLDSGQLVFEMSAGDNADTPLIIETFLAVRAGLHDGERLKYRPVSNGQEQKIPELAPSIPIVTTAELYAGQTYQPLNQGVGYGTLRFRKASQLAGQPLAPTDIVVLDRVPNDIAVVSGIITAEFQTPLSHINILSKQRKTPNMALREAFDDATLRAFDGELVKLTVDDVDYAIELADPTEAQAWWEARRPATPLVPQHDLSATAIRDLATADVTDVLTIGAKAANFAELRLIRPPVAPVTVRAPSPAFAIPFHHFDRHMTTHGLWADVEAILAEQPAGLELERRLFALRWKIFSAPMDATLKADLAALVAERLAGVDLRFRSSTNVEDLAEFSGAGLYTSAGTDAGASADALERAVKVVWASAWNHGAYVERDFYRVVHREVMMGVLIHPAFTGELANGVALTMNEFSALRPAYYVNAQIGDVSVTNPTGEATPEQILWYTYYQDGAAAYEVITRSSLTGGAPVLTDAQYGELASYLEATHRHFKPIYCGGVAGCGIDVEWKLASDGFLYLKQARPLRTQ